MYYFIYNENTGELTGSRPAQIDPVNSDAQRLEGNIVYLGHGKYETNIEPPQEKTGYARCFINGSWQQIEDHRGKMMYSTIDISPNSIIDLGPIPEGFTLLQPCEYPKWDTDNNMWIVDETLKKNTEDEALIQAEMMKIIRDQAIANLQAQGKL